ncbi:hypothetical protein [Sinomonas sp. P10A9]|uniref:HNH endonuclease n=1 Tax=Sinomonas puerhi TaxID=3238584 RepID=A0AB39L7R9_9MICC
MFHYAAKKFQALSRVVSNGVEAQRPHAYTGDLDGTLVLVEPVVVDMEISIDRLAELFPPGVGPINKSRKVGRVYISPVPAAIGGPLAGYLSRGSEMVRGPEGSSEGASSLPRGALMPQSTDVIRARCERAEQQFLRMQLLADYGPQCAICGKVLPKDLLVAAHIKRRSECTDVERLDFGAAAMLTCTLGCDSLFENGYLRVDDEGNVRAAATEFAGLSAALSDLDGACCLAFSEATTRNFEFHRNWHANRSAVPQAQL